MKKTIHTTGRHAFFQVGDNWFADVLHNFDHDIEVDYARLARWLAAEDPNEIVIGRKLSQQKIDIVLDGRDDVDADAYSRIIPDQAKLRMGMKVP